MISSEVVGPVSPGAMLDGRGSTVKSLGLCSDVYETGRASSGH